MTRNMYVVGALALAVFIVGSASGAPLSERAAQRQRTEQQVAKVEERLAALTPDGVKSEVLAAQAKSLLELSRRFLSLNNLAAAQVQADVAERLTRLAEGKAVGK
jgi:hypothetical protein